MSATLPDMNVLEAWIAEADAAALKAAELVKPVHAKALEGAARLRDALAEIVSPESRKRRLCAIIEKAVAKRFKDAPASRYEQAGVILGQYAANLSSVSFRGITDTNQRDGAFIIRTFHSYGVALAPEQRLKVLDALILAAQGKIETGLIDFAGAKDWPACLTEEAADALAALADPEAHAQFLKDKESLVQNFTNVQLYLDALQQATPALFRVNPKSASTVSIRNNRPGDLGIGDGLFFKGGGAVTELDMTTFARVRDSEYFQAYVNSGDLEIAAPAKLAERI